MTRWFMATLAGALLTSTAFGQLRSIEPDVAKGSSAAVVVPDSAPLLHTGQLAAPSGTAEQQIRDVFAQFERILQKHGVGTASVVKMNFVVAKDDMVPMVERIRLRDFAGKDKPAVSFVTGKLSQADVLVALDAVVALPAAAAVKQVRVTADGAILPPGARVWISGQAENAKDLAEATHKTMEGLRDSLKFVGLKENAIVQIKSFVQPIAKVEEARREIEKFFGNQPVPPLVFVEWKSSLPIEIELIAWGGRERAGEPLEFLTPPAMKPSPVFSRIARVNYGKLIYVSGLHAQKADNPAGEITEVFDSLGGILKKAGSDYRHLAKATYYCTTAETVKKMGELRPKYYDPKRPPAASLAMTEGVGRTGKTMTLDMIAVPSPTIDVNEYGPAEYGHGLTEKDALDGWISLFDGKTTFGWNKARIENGCLAAGESTTQFSDFELKGIMDKPGPLLLGRAGPEPLNPGRFAFEASVGQSVPIKIGEGAAVRTLLVRPRQLQPLFNGKDLAGWKRIDHAKLPKERWPSWTVKDGALHALGGPGCVEYQGRKFGDLILQVEARMNVRHANGGLFFRAIPGDFMNGYEAQLYNRCMDSDPGKPAVWATGAIDDRQNARRLVSRDGQWFVQTVIANGPHIATWVNGYQTVDWTDTRAKHVNPRLGLRLDPGVIQLQAHDVATDIEFRKVAARALE